MTLADLSLPISFEDSQQYVLVFTPELAARLAELHSLVGRPDCMAIPTPLSDGRMALRAAVLTATAPGGYLHEMWEAADKEVLLPSVEVMEWADISHLLPPPDPPPELP